MEIALNSEEVKQISPLGGSVDPGFKREIKDTCGEDVMSCYQCGECTAGCPAAFSMDIAPNQIMRMTQLGMKDEVLASSSIWLCAGCETCATRCPRGVALSKVMDSCRQIAVKEGRKVKEPNVLKFHDQFLKEVSRFGRVHELTLMGMYKMRSKRFFDDVILGIPMFLKGKLGLIPSFVKGRGEVRKLIKKS
ncbi:MAG: 4Fe-4S dicluster domain-containing protein [Armatimonadota bacterium]|nr:4Fe-4S dicluster domain-containing protein [bacterium]